MAKERLEKAADLQRKGAGILSEEDLKNIAGGTGRGVVCPECGSSNTFFNMGIGFDICGDCDNVF